MKENFLFRVHTRNYFFREQGDYITLFHFKCQVANEEISTIILVMKMLLYETLTFDESLQVFADTFELQEWFH